MADGTESSLKRDRDENDESERPPKVVKADTSEHKSEETEGIKKEDQAAAQEAGKDEDGNSSKPEPNPASAVKNNSSKDEVAKKEEEEEATSGLVKDIPIPKIEKKQTAGELPSGLPMGLPSQAPIDPAAQPTVTNPDSIVEERAEISGQYVGRVIGKGGEMIRDLQARSGCRMDVDQNVAQGQPRILTYRGTRKTVNLAKQMVAMLCTPAGDQAQLPLGEASRRDMSVPSTSVGKIIGRGGEMIRELQSRSHAKIQVDHTGKMYNSDTRSVTITGTPDAVAKAEEMVMFLVANPLMDAMAAIQMLCDDKAKGTSIWGSGPPYQNLPNNGQNMTPSTSIYPNNPPPQSHYGGYGGTGANPGYPPQQPSQGYYGGAPVSGGPHGAAPAGGSSEMEVFPAAKMYMGRIIGRGGITINDLQKRSGCDIQVNQDVAPGQDCQITIKGSRPGIESVKQMLRDIIDMGPNHPYAGGGGQYGGGGNTGKDRRQQGYMHQLSAVQHQSPMYGGGYHQQPHHGAPPIYGQPQGYGGSTPHQPYGMPVPHHQQSPYGNPMPSYQQGQYHQPPMTHQQQPSFAAPPAPPPVMAPSGWKSATAADGQVYYYNEKTGETQWEKPAGM